MAKDLSPKCKICRRAGEKLFLKGDRCNTVKCAMVKRNYPPGFHGAKGRQRSTDYGLRLREKQKAKNQYGMLEKQFRITFDKAKSMKGNTGENFLRLLETRFDNVVYRLGLGSSRREARQLVGHAHFSINGHNTNISSFQLKPGDIIKIKTNKRNFKIYKEYGERLKKKEMPGWLNFDQAEFAAKVLHQPDIASIKPNFDVQMIVEYYSR